MRPLPLCHRIRRSAANIRAHRRGGVSGVQMRATVDAATASPKRVSSPNHCSERQVVAIPATERHPDNEVDRSGVPLAL